MTSFWDIPGNTPPSGSWPIPDGPPVEGTITRLVVETSRYGRPSLCVELDGDGMKRWCGMRLWRALAELRVDIGERIRVTRLPDEPGAPGERPTPRWRVERVAAPAPVPQASAWGPPPGQPAAAPSRPAWGPDRPQW